MINIRHNFAGQKERGYSTLATTVVVLLLITLITFLTARAVITEQQTATNQYRVQQAFDAGQSGLDYGLTYLNENQGTVTDGMVINGTLPSGAAYNITYEFQGGNTVIKIISIGTSIDGSATRTVEQLVKKVTTLGGGTSPVIPLTGRGQVDLSGTAVITNLENNITINTGDPTVIITSSAQTVLAGGVSSTAGDIQSDIVYDPSLTTLSDDDLMMNVLGATITQLAATATVTASGTGNTNYNTLVNGVTGTTVHITQAGEALFSAGTIVGTAESPVNLIVSGDVKIFGNVIIYGNVITTGNVDIGGNVQVFGLVFSLGDITAGTGSSSIQGAIVAGGLMSLSGSTNVTYDSATLQSTSGSGSGGAYGKIPGSWKDISG